MNGPLVGVPCSYCDAKAEDPCTTSGGWVFREGAHAVRTKRAAADGKKLDTLQSGPTSRTTLAANKVKLALWYIDKAGGIASARTLLDLAATALDQVPDDERGTSSDA